VLLVAWELAAEAVTVAPFSKRATAALASSALAGLVIAGWAGC